MIHLNNRAQLFSNAEKCSADGFGLHVALLGDIIHETGPRRVFESHSLHKSVMGVENLGSLWVGIIHPYSVSQSREGNRTENLYIN